jgi:misacylated tRNA(Ala) deacylase
MPTDKLFLADAYLTSAEATVLGHTEEGGVRLDRSLFYATSGGQPGDTGWLETGAGARIDIETARYLDPQKTEIVLIPKAGAALPAVGTTVVQHLDWKPRYRRMRIHTGLHLLSAVLPFPVTGGAIGDDEGRLDFDLTGEQPDRETAEAALNALIAGEHAVSTEWITDAELEANPALVKTLLVKPPMGTGQIRMVRIGTPDASVDWQPCGGTHVANTREIGPVTLSKIENKGKANRRVRLRFVEG